MRDRTVINNCQLEIDHARGVIYIHLPAGYTGLRICGLPTPVPSPLDSGQHLLDITLKWGKVFSWRGEQPEIVAEAER